MTKFEDIAEEIKLHPSCPACLVIAMKINRHLFDTADEAYLQNHVHFLYDCKKPFLERVGFNFEDYPERASKEQIESHAKMEEKMKEKSP